MNMLAGALSAAFWGLLFLSVLVFVHEGGHYVVARLFGVRVTEFMIGLPGPHIGIQRVVITAAVFLTEFFFPAFGRFAKKRDFLSGFTVTPELFVTGRPRF